MAPDGLFSGEITAEYEINCTEPIGKNLSVVDYLPGYLGQSHPDGNMFVQTFRDVEYIDKVTQPFVGTRWRGEVKYTRRSFQRPEYPEQPSVFTPYSIAFNFANRQEVLEVDRFGNVVANSLGDKFDTPPMARVNETTFTISRNELWNPIQKLINYNPKYGAVNADPMWFFNPRTLLLSIGAQVSIGADGVSQNGWNVSYKFDFNYDTWDYSALNAGYFAMDGSDKVRLLDDTDDKRPIQKPKALNASGEVLGESDPAEFLFWEKSIPMNFSALNLPNITAVW